MSQVIQEILELARSEGADALLEMTASLAHEPVYDRAIEAHGSWDAALAHTIIHLLEPPTAKARSTAAPASTKEEEIVRLVTGAVQDPLFATTASGHLFRIDPAHVEITDAPQVFETPSGAGPIQSFHHLGDPDGVFAFSNVGRYYGLIPRVIPEWKGSTELRDVHDILPALYEDEFLVAALPRRAGISGRVVHITARGKGKASEADEYGRTLDQSGREAFLVNSGDLPVAVLTGPEDNSVFCASAMGQGIHFDAADIRSMGRKAVGVNVMKLDGEHDAVVNAFLGNGVEQVAVITEQGLGKRVWFSEFRQQGRAGAGMQLIKLNSGDRVAGMVSLDASLDLIVTTSTGRVHRREAGDFELMGRPAKGNTMIDLDDDETVIGLSVAPTSTENL